MQWYYYQVSKVQSYTSIPCPHTTPLTIFNFQMKAIENPYSHVKDAIIPPITKRIKTLYTKEGYR